MAIWLFRAGKSGEYENKFLTDKKIFLTWDGLNLDLSQYSDKQKLIGYLLNFYDDAKPNTVRNWLGQIYPIAHRIKIGDWIVLPSKLKSAIHIGKVMGEYVYDPKAGNPFYHYRNVDWFAQDIPRSNFDQDILYSLGAFMTVCQIQRNDAEERIKSMGRNNWKVKVSDIITDKITAIETNDERTSFFDLEEHSNDLISNWIIRKFKGDRMESLIESILKAKGYTTYRSPKGTDKGIDLLAAPGPMGFGSPRLCVQVKTSDMPVDRPTLSQLIGSIHNYNADQGLLVSWSGFKNTVEEERSVQFFKVRLWGQKEIINELIENYDKLDDDIKAEIPLKRIWTLSIPDNE